MGCQRILALAVLVSGCTHSTPASEIVPSPPSIRYEVTIFDNFGGAETRVCARGFVVREFAPMHAGAGRSMVRAWSEAGPLPIRGGRIVLPANGSTGCVHYQTRFSGEMFRSPDDSSMIVSQSQWLWRPVPLPADVPASLVVNLPDGARASLPFAHDGESHVLERDAFRRDGYTVFGSFDDQRFSVGEASVSTVLLGPRPEPPVVQSWLDQAVRTAGAVGGYFPVPRIHVVIVPVEGIDQPVAFGMVRRGGGPSVLLLTSPAADLDELRTDWVAIHELSHLWLPRLFSEDRWLSEGLATYMQEVLRARCELQTADVSWDRIRDGLARGRRSGTGRDLTGESRDMGRTGAYHRVYWSGTAFALDADTKLRAASDGEMTLLDAIALAQPRLREVKELMSAQDLLAELDTAAGTNFLTTLGAQYAASSTFPKTPAVDDPKLATVRAAIMAPDPEKCGVSDEASQ